MLNTAWRQCCALLNVKLAASQGGFVINRREFLEAAAVSAVPAIAGAARRVAGSEEHPRPPVAVRTVLIDERYREARSVGARLAARGAALLALPDGDVTEVWLKHIGPAWKDAAVPVAGLTARPALFCLEQCALGCGLRVVFHSEHIVHRQGRAEHRLLRGADTAGISVRDLTLAGWLWPARIAEALAAYPNQIGRTRFGRSEAGLSPTLPPGAQLLTSWIIAAA
jgi:hypothetical protein